MENLNNPAIAAAIITFAFGIFGWMIRELYAWVKSLTRDVKDLSVVIAGITSDYKNLKENFLKLENKVDQRPTVNYKK
jgi:hypothetical protein